MHESSGRKDTRHARPADLGELIRQVCLRPAMYAGSYRWDLAAAFIDGCWFTLSWLKPEAYPRAEWSGFNRWLAEKFDYPRNHGWISVRGAFPDDEAAFAALPSLYGEFREQHENR